MRHSASDLDTLSSLSYGTVARESGADLATLRDVHPTQIVSWKNELLGRAAEIFGSGTNGEPQSQETIRELHEKIGELTVECKLLGLNRTGVYYQPRPVPEKDLQLMRRIDESHLEFPYYGARHLAQQLKREDWDVGRLHVRSLMRRMGIAALYRRPRTSILARGASIYRIG